MANSRDLVRSDTLFPPPLAARSGFSRFAQFSRKLTHLERTETRFETFVAAFQACAVDGLFERIAGQHTKHDWYARIHLRELQAARSLRANVIIVRRFPAKDAPNGDQRIVPARPRHFLGGQGQLERSRHVHHIHVVALGPASRQGIQRRLEQTLGYKTVESAHYNSQTQTPSAQPPLDFVGLDSLGHRNDQFPLNCAARFSRNAFVPSRMSAVAQHNPKSVASRKSPSSSGISAPRSMASMQYFTASGAFSMIFFAMVSAAGSNSAGSYT